MRFFFDRLGREGVVYLRQVKLGAPECRPSI